MSLTWLLPHRFDHRVALGDGRGHRLLDEDVFAVPRGADGLLRVDAVRRDDVDDVDVLRGAQRLDRRLGADGEFPRRRRPARLPPATATSLTFSDGWIAAGCRPAQLPEPMIPTRNSPMCCSPIPGRMPTTEG